MIRVEIGAAPARLVADATVPDGGIPVRPVRPFSFGLVAGLGVLAALLIGGLAGQLSVVLLYIGLALFLALGLDPVVSMIERRLPRAAAVAIVVGSVVIVFAGIVVTIVPLVVEQVQNLIDNLPAMVQDVTTSPWYKDVTQQYGPDIEKSAQGAVQFIQNPGNLTALGGGLLAVGAGIAGGLTGTTIVLILTLYFMISLRPMKRVAARFVPAYRREGFTEVLNDVSNAVGRYVIGQVSLALINGVLTLVLMLIIRGPIPALLALIAFLGSLIPLVGTLSGAIVISLICLLASPQTALAAIIYYLVYMQIEAYVLSPRIMSKAVAVPGALVVTAAVAGGTVGGVLGALVAIPVTASAIIIVQKVVFPAQDRKTTKNHATAPIPG